MLCAGCFYVCKNAVKGRVCDSVRAGELVDMVKYIPAFLFKLLTFWTSSGEREAERQEEEVTARLAQEADSKGTLVF